VCGKYATVRSSIDEIRKNHTCMCGVDAKQLPEEITSRRFDRAIFQFPLVPPVSKAEWAKGRKDVVCLNRSLLLAFLRQVEPLLVDDGLILITSKDVAPYFNWRLEWALTPHTEGLRYLGKIAFNSSAFPSYNCQNVNRDQRVKQTLAFTYIFGRHALEDTDVIPPLNIPKDALYCEICPAGIFSSEGDMKNHFATKAHKEKVGFEKKWLTEWVSEIISSSCSVNEQGGEILLSSPRPGAACLTAAAPTPTPAAAASPMSAFPELLNYDDNINSFPELNTKEWITGRLGRRGGTSGIIIATEETPVVKPSEVQSQEASLSRIRWPYGENVGRKNDDQQNEGQEEEEKLSTVECNCDQPKNGSTTTSTSSRRDDEENGKRVGDIDDDDDDIDDDDIDGNETTTSKRMETSTTKRMENESARDSDSEHTLSRKRMKLKTKPCV